MVSLLVQFVWDYLGVYSRVLLAPLNVAVFGNATVQLVGLLVTLVLLVGLLFYGRSQWPLLLLLLLWLGLTLFPVLNLALSSDELPRLIPSLLIVPPNADNLQQNRYLYLPAAGFCAAVAVLFYAFYASLKRLRLPVLAGYLLLLLVAAALCWPQLQPWHTASVQVNDLIAQLLRVVPVRNRPNGLVWYAQGTPFKYDGVPLLLSGMGVSRLLVDGDADYPQVLKITDAATFDLTQPESRDIFALRLAYDQPTNHFVVDYAAGITALYDPPTAAEADTNLLIWDFRGCESATKKAWRVSGASAKCNPGVGQSLIPGGADPQMVAAQLNVTTITGAARFVRLRVALRPQPGNGARSGVLQWFWHGNNADFSSDHVVNMAIKDDGQAHVYWTFLPLAQVGPAISALRLDPVDSSTPVDVAWIALDLVR